jgi:hypothetical protein
MPDISLSEVVVISDNAPYIPKKHGACQIIKEGRIHEKYGDKGGRF